MAKSETTDSWKHCYSPSPNTGAYIYRVNVAAAKLGVSRATIYRLVKAHELDLVKIGRRSSGITAASIQALLERNLASG
ncbi:DNA-binding protein [Allopusillimonas soli]|uniref:Helix-turn-helix domain-containing protein n=1 Tax=Allopusillimonas soli TaxID=659016 RepID=A0A853F7R3_9BURK|nr:helix-turn-helix domain-containing protein [Allopusillimonas soli]NYT36635.1 helix-turn-helix domain-containing protein [Allopusillimonas soli]TEA75120.1 DNA-binding protein [Allopusillimonas soli]